MLTNTDIMKASLTLPLVKTCDEQSRNLMVPTSKAEKLKLLKTVLKPRAVLGPDHHILGPDLPGQEVDDPVLDVQDPTQDQHLVQGPDPGQDRHPGPDHDPEIRMVMATGGRAPEAGPDLLIKTIERRTVPVIEWMSRKAKMTERYWEEI